MQLPGANFELVEHEGTVTDLIRALDEIADLPVPETGPNLIVVDSSTPIWGLIGQEVRLAKTNKQGADTSDLWVDGKGDWQAILNALRRHRGPSIVTARLEESVVYADGHPTRERSYRIQGERALAYDADIVIEMPKRGEPLLTKANSLALGFNGTRALPVDFTMHDIWEAMGLGKTSADRVFTVLNPHTVEALDTSGRDWSLELNKCISLAQVEALGRDAAAAQASPEVKAAIRKKYTALSPKPPAAK